MKKICKIFVLVSGLLFFKTANAAIFPDYTPLLPFAPQICFQCTPATISFLTSTIDQVNTMHDKLTGGELITSVTQSFTSYALSFGKSKLNYLKQNLAKRKKVVSASRTIEDSKLTVAADIKDEAKVKEAFIELFLQYPSKNGNKKMIYANNGKQLSMDTTLEMYITAREMDKEVRTILAELDTIERCLVAGEDCSEEGLEQYNCQSDGTEDEVCIWRNALTAVRLYDKIMRYNEFLIAMNAQYNAVRSIGGTAKIREYEEKEDEKGKKHSSLGLYPETSKLALNSASRVITIKEASIEENFDTLDGAGLESPVAGKEKEFESLEIISDAKKAMNEAIMAHNYKQALPQYRGVFETYNNFLAYKKKTGEYEDMSFGCVARYLGHYYDDSKSDAAWYGVNCTRDNKKYQCHYSPEKLFTDTAESIGDYDVACSNDRSKKCYVISRVDLVKEEKGINGWLLALQNNIYNKIDTENQESYENGESSSDYVSEVLDTTSDGLTSLKDMKSQSDKNYKNDENGENSKTYKKPSMEEDIYAEGRANALMNWTLGRETAQMINKEFISKSSTFGKTKSGSSLWNDQKYFYDGYLNGKYDNISAYIEKQPIVSQLAKVALAINAKYPYTGVDAEKQRADTVKAIKKMVESFETGLSSDELDAKLVQARTDLQKVTDNYLQTVNSLKAQKSTIYTQLDKLSETYSDTVDELNQAKSDASSAEVSMEKSEDAIKAGKKLERGSTVSPQRAGFSSNIKDSKALKAEAEKKIKELQPKVNSLKKQIENTRKKLENTDTKMYQAKADYVALYNETENKLDKEITAAAKSYAETKAKFIKAEQSGLTANPVMLIANKMLEQARAQAQTYVDEAKTEINGLGGEKYTTAGAAQIKSIHQNLLQKLKNLGLKPDDSKYGQYLEQFNDIFAETVTGKEAEDSDYFVGIVERERDFTSPKSPLDFSSAPLREVFHFDVDDYDAVLKRFKNGVNKTPESNSDVTLIGNSLLLSGLDLPKIWEQILTYRPYVEKTIDLKELLNKSGSVADVTAASGIYPCLMGNTPITVGEHGYTKADHAFYKCLNLVDGKDIEAGASIKINNKAQISTLDWSKASELGQLLDYVEEIEVVAGLKIVKSGHLTFNKYIQKAIYNLERSGNIDKDKNAARDYFMYSRMLFEHNQIGDYLGYKELDVQAQRALELQEQQVKGVRDKLKEIFNALGYDISDDFDLSNASDYKNAEDTLKKYKQGYMRRLENLIASISGETELIISGKEQLENGLAVLKKDDNEEAAVSAYDDLDELEEKIKTARANMSVTDVYDNEGKDSFKKQMENLRPPYCAVYPY